MFSWLLPLFKEELLGGYACVCRTLYVLEQGNIIGDANVSGSRSEMNK